MSYFWKDIRNGNSYECFDRARWLSVTPQQPLPSMSRRTVTEFSETFLLSRLRGLSRDSNAVDVARRLVRRLRLPNKRRSHDRTVRTVRFSPRRTIPCSISVFGRVRVDLYVVFERGVQRVQQSVVVIERGVRAWRYFENFNHFTFSCFNDIAQILSTCITHSYRAKKINVSKINTECNRNG